MYPFQFWGQGQEVSNGSNSVQYFKWSNILGI